MTSCTFLVTCWKQRLQQVLTTGTGVPLAIGDVGPGAQSSATGSSTGRIRFANRARTRSRARTPLGLDVSQPESFDALPNLSNGKNRSGTEPIHPNVISELVNPGPNTNVVHWIRPPFRSKWVRTASAGRDAAIALISGQLIAANRLIPLATRRLSRMEPDYAGTDTTKRLMSIQVYEREVCVSGT
ncbi:MAG TPA: hypothetical protein VEX68_20485 [Bryobacteraceae bacterium]|nr:hypothetical protein [Bryobacteraceae bacterium]